MNTRHSFYKRAAIISNLTGYYKSAYDYMVKYDLMYHKLVDLNSEKTMNEVIREEYKKTLTRFEMVAKVGRDITMYDDLDQVLLFALDALSSFMSIDSIGIGILKDEELKYEHFFNEGRKLNTKSIPLSNKSSLAVWSIINKKELISNDIENDNVIYTNEPLIREKAKQSSDLDINSVMFLPLVVKRETVGVFTIQSYKKYAYSKEDMEIFNIIGSYVAIALKNIKQAEDLERLSTTDGLTGLLNRRGFIEKFEEKILSQPRSIGMIMLDLDLFKQINDLYGHLFGDKVLQLIGIKLKSFEDKDTLLSRMGGEEFAFIAFDQTKESIQ
ncbi:sensor domain-containing diguanylate cyclase, partial [Sphaerochaeta sp. S2]|uniref:sensor domain-containing diguanylate cyclase n=1 Tax=Sphaerochaeta sp. S2 TaxID=2798868 RepID=UPI0018E9661D